jgi:hypothetical protein
MGYNLHITRKDSWAVEAGPAISLDEWQEYVALDEEIESDPDSLGFEDYVLVSHPERWPLWWSPDRAEIYTKNPDKAVIAKLVAIAQALRARVLGDDDEIYGLDPSDPTKAKRR